MLANETEEMDVLAELFQSENRRLVDSELKQIFTCANISDSLRQNVLYHLCLDSKPLSSTYAHSKRLRSYLCLLFGEENGHSKSTVLPLAITVELIHNATLIIDDIQDNDAMRCDREALWKKVGLPKAVNVAFYISNLAQAYYHSKRLECNLRDFTDRIIEHLDSLFTGQEADISLRIPNVDSLSSYTQMVDGKSGSLLVLACIMGAFPYPGVGSEEEINTVRDFATNFARLHQLQDDLLEVTSAVDLDSQLKKDNGNVFQFLLPLGSSGQAFDQSHMIGAMEEVQAYQNILEQRLSGSVELLYHHSLARTDTIRGLSSYAIDQSHMALQRVVSGVNNDTP